MIKKIRKCDDRPSRALAARNQVAQTNTNAVNAGGENEAERKLREVLDKLSRIAHALAVKFHWQENLVFADLVSDLRILAEPARLAELEDNPINQMTREIMSQFLASPEEFEVFRNDTVEEILAMPEQEAVRRIGMYVRQGLLGDTERYMQIENAPRQAQLENVRHDSVEDSPNEDAFTAKFGVNNLNRFKRLKQKMTAPDNDITAWTAHGTVEELNEYLNEVEYYNMPILVENENWVVIKVETREQGERIDSRRSWCVFKPAAWNQNTEILTQMGFAPQYYVYLNKYDLEDRYCVVFIPGLGTEIANVNNKEIATLPADVPEVDGISTVSTVVGEDTPIEEATVATLINQLHSKTDEELYTMYLDIFPDVNEYEGEELREYIAEQIRQYPDKVELTHYVENHLEEFANHRPAEIEEENYDYDDEDDYEEDDYEEDDDYIA